MRAPLRRSACVAATVDASGGDGTHVAIRQLKAIHRQTHPSATLEPRPARDAGAAVVDERQLELFAALAAEEREDEHG